MGGRRGCACDGARRWHHPRVGREWLAAAPGRTRERAGRSDVAQCHCRRKVAAHAASGAAAALGARQHGIHRSGRRRSAGRGLRRCGRGERPRARARHGPCGVRARPATGADRIRR